MMHFKFPATHILILLASFSMLSAQGTDRKAQRAQLEEERKAIYIRVLSLTADEQTKFFPIFNSMKGEMDVLHKQQKSIRKSMAGGVAGKADTTLNRIATKMLTIEQGLLDIKKKYFERFKTVIPISKVVLIPKAEREFKKLLLEKVKAKREAVDVDDENMGDD